MLNKSLVRSIIIFLLSLTAVGILLFSDFGKNRTVVYDCRMSEISPDFPIEVKDECRKLRLEHYRQEQKRNYI
jgi:hypothetical protein